MEDNTAPLEIVCRHFRNEYGNETIKNLRRRLQKAYRRTAGLKKDLAICHFRQGSLKTMNALLTALLRRLIYEVSEMNSKLSLDAS